MHLSPPRLESSAGRQWLGGEAGCQVPTLGSPSSFFSSSSSASSHPPTVPAATSSPNTSSIAETAALRLLLLLLPPPAGASSAAPIRAHLGGRRKWLFHSKRYWAARAAEDRPEGQAYPCPSLQSAGEKGRGQGRQAKGEVWKGSGRRLFSGRRCRCSYFSPPPSLLLLLGELPRAPTKTSRGVWLCAPAPSDRAAVSLRGEKHVTEPPRSAAGPPPPPQPGGSRPGLYIPGRSRPAPAPLRPPALPQRRPRRAPAQR
uniref:translation initiation factor IF-2-like n=1 Tax=Callithrix jacchus TaxID=9483 RepID=UPI0023DD1473|nr:translation initiation factor IF-2-like [Callithrix jacchus]